MWELVTNTITVQCWGLARSLICSNKPASFWDTLLIMCELRCRVYYEEVCGTCGWCSWRTWWRGSGDPAKLPGTSLLPVNRHRKVNFLSIVLFLRNWQLKYMHVWRAQQCSSTQLRSVNVNDKVPTISSLIFYSKYYCVN